MEKERSAAADQRGLIDWDAAGPDAEAVGEATRPGRRRQRRSHRRPWTSWTVIAGLAAASAVAGGLAGCHPTGTPLLDPFYTAAASAVVTVAASRASRAATLMLATVAAALSRQWLLVPAGFSLGLAFGATFLRRPYARLQALIGALCFQVALRWPHLGVHGLTAAAAFLGAAVVLVSAWLRLSRRWRRRVGLAAGSLAGGAVVLSAPLGIGALLAWHSVHTGIDQSRAALTSVSDGDSARAVTELGTATSALRRAHTYTSGWWTAGGLLVPGVAQQRRVITGDTTAAADLTALAGQEAGRLDYHNVRYHQGQIDLASIRLMGAPLAVLDRHIIATQAAIRRPRSQWLLAPLARDVAHLSGELDRARSSAELGILAAKDAPALLGGDGVRHYFVAFVTPAETRGLDGLLGAYAELAVDQGRITLTRSAPITALGPVLNAPQLVGVPDYMARYGAFDPSAHFQDVTYSPDLPTVTKVIAQMYPAAGGDTIDGVLMLDPHALSVLLRFTGPISLTGLPYPLTASNADRVLLRDEYSIFPNAEQPSRDAFLQQALAEAFRRLSAGSLPGPKKLSAALDPVVRQGRLLLWSTHPEDQPLLDRLDLDGSFPQPGPGRDVLAVTVANADNNKLDAYLHESVDDRVSYEPVSGRITSTVTVRLNNQAPSAGLPDYVIGVHSGANLPPGTNLLWVSVYSPLNLTGSSVDGAVTAFSPAVRELGVYAYSAFVAVPSGATSTIRLTFQGAITPGRFYRLALRLQPLANPPSVSVTAGKSTWTAGPDEVQQHAWRF